MNRFKALLFGKRIDVRKTNNNSTLQAKQLKY